MASPRPIKDAGAPQRRRYRSTLRGERAAQTRRTVLEAATPLFAERGWASTGMREVAVAAGVAIETVYAHFGSKAGLLRAVADAAVVGDEVPVPLQERPEFRAMGTGQRSARIHAAARLLAAVQVRTGPIAKVLRQAAHDDGEIRKMLHATRERQRLDVAAAVELVVGRPPSPQERDGVWALASPEVFLLLVDDSGWTPEMYETWFATTLERVIPRS